MLVGDFLYVVKLADGDMSMNGAGVVEMVIGSAEYDFGVVVDNVVVFFGKGLGFFDNLHCFK